MLDTTPGWIDDDKKLLFIVADGLIKGSGNDAMTPEIVLNILGVEGKDWPGDKTETLLTPHLPRCTHQTYQRRGSASFRLYCFG